jgi:hypothetical protein
MRDMFVPIASALRTSRPEWMSPSNKIGTAIRFDHGGLSAENPERESR